MSCYVERAAVDNQIGCRVNAVAGNVFKRISTTVEGHGAAVRANAVFRQAGDVERAVTFKHKVFGCVDCSFHLLRADGCVGCAVAKGVDRAVGKGDSCLDTRLQVDCRSVAVGERQACQSYAEIGCAIHLEHTVGRCSRQAKFHRLRRNIGHDNVGTCHIDVHAFESERIDDCNAVGVVGNGHYFAFAEG